MDSIPKRLRYIREKRGFKTAEAAAKRFGWNAVTLRAHENLKESATPRGITRAAARYAKAYKVSEAWLRCLTDDEDSGVKGAPIVGQAAAGVWHEEMTQFQAAASGHILVPASEADDESSLRFSVLVADDTINKALPRDTYAICEPVADAPAPDDFVVGDILYIERTNKAKMREFSLRRVSSLARNAVVLSTYSTGPKKADLHFPAPSGAERVRILGKVVGKYADYVPA